MTWAAPSIRCWSKGQLVGGLAQGLGGALLRGVPLRRARRAAFGDASPTIWSRPCTTSRPSMSCSPQDAPSPRNPLGLKGAGEGGVNAVGAAIASAIDDAIGQPGAIVALPVTPSRLKALLDRAGIASCRARWTKRPDWIKLNRALEPAFRGARTRFATGEPHAAPGRRDRFRPARSAIAGCAAGSTKSAAWASCCRSTAPIGTSRWAPSPIC